MIRLQPKLLSVTAALLLAAASVRAQITTEPPGPPTVAEILDQTAQPYQSDKASLSTLFYTIGKTYRLNIMVDPAVKGDAVVRFNGGTVRELIQNLVLSNDLVLDLEDNSIHIRRTSTTFYFLEYPQVARSSTSSTSITLTPSSANGVNGTTSIGGGVTMQAQQNVGTGVNGQQGGDNTSLSIQEKSEDSFWESISRDIKDLTREFETITINRFSGIVSVDTTPSRRSYWKTYFDHLNGRINAQVLVEVRIDQIDLNDTHKLGVDWNQIQTQIGGNDNLLAGFTGSTNVTQIANRVLPGDTLLGNISAGKLTAVLHALKEQGTLHNVSKPTIRLLNNQKGFVKVGEDRTFFSLYADVRVDTGGIGGGQTTSQEIYQQQRQTFGVVLPVTAQVSHDGWITLVLEPARTQLNGIEPSPDGKQTAPITGAQTIATMLRLRSGETAIVGGLRTESKVTGTRRIPIVGDLPFIGRLARTDAKSTVSSELLVSVTAQIIQ